MWRSAFETYQRHRFASLFLTLLLTLAGYPFLKALGLSSSFLEALLILNLLAATATVGRERGFRAPLYICLAILVLRGVQVVLGSRVILPLTEAFWVLACLLATTAAARHAWGVGAVNSERIFAALDVYLLVGLMFGVGYFALEQTWPGSFSQSATEPFSLGKAIYFSFVTLATLGYGDIVPVHDPARGLSILEAITGQMYIAVLVARLVSSYAEKPGPPSRPGSPLSGLSDRGRERSP